MKQRTLQIPTTALLTAVFLVVPLAIGSNAFGQATLTNQTAPLPTRSATLEEYLVRRLRISTDEQRSYIKVIVRLVEQRQLQKNVVLALERYANRKNPFFPFPIYERALRSEAFRRGVTVPTIKEIVARNGASAAAAVRDSRIR